MKEVERYVNDAGLIGFLWSSGHGAGWSTWASDEEEEFILFDKRLVEMALEGANQREVEKYLKESGKQHHAGGWKGIQVAFCNPGSRVIVSEYDGNEDFLVNPPPGGMVA